MSYPQHTGSMISSKIPFPFTSLSASSLYCLRCTSPESLVSEARSAMGFFGFFKTTDSVLHALSSALNIPLVFNCPASPASASDASPIFFFASRQLVETEGHVSGKPSYSVTHEVRCPGHLRTANISAEVLDSCRYV